MRPSEVFPLSNKTGMACLWLVLYFYTAVNRLGAFRYHDSGTAIARSCTLSSRCSTEQIRVEDNETIDIYVTGSTRIPGTMDSGSWCTCTQVIQEPAVFLIQSTASKSWPRSTLFPCSRLRQVIPFCIGMPLPTLEASLCPHWYSPHTPRAPCDPSLE